MKYTDLSQGECKAALFPKCFPAPFQAVIFRNWEMVEPERIAEVLECSADSVRKAAAEMGLNPNPDKNIINSFVQRGYLTVIRANWHLLNYKQLLQLLDWTPERMDSVLREEDFFWVKLGKFKPVCEDVLFRQLSDAEKKMTAEIAEIVSANNTVPKNAEAPFHFLNRFGEYAEARKNEIPAKQDHLRMIYSYSALYGDPFAPDASDPYPEALLRDYQASGINAVWLQGILYQLVPWLGEELPFSKGWEQRIKGLNALIQKTAKYGIKVYLYFNEPRALPASFPLKQDFRGALFQLGAHTFCPWKPGMLEAFSAGVEQLFRAAPELGGIFCIDFNENPTHCLSKPWEIKEQCPLCSQHTVPENLSLIFRAIQNGIKRSGSKARMIVWDWSWFPGLQPDIRKKALLSLPDGCDFMSVSENSIETVCHGVKGTVFDYSISKPGPGPIALEAWKITAANGHRNVAKIQVNTTWELSCVPAIPVPYLVKKHLDNLKAIGIEDYMVSWTLGGASGGNMELLDHSIEEIARRDYGEHAEQIMHIWKGFSDAFALIPFHLVQQIYNSPQNIGPAVPIYEKPTGYTATMVCGFPYDDLETWSGYGHYPYDVLEAGYAESAEGWHKALSEFEKLGSVLTGKAANVYESQWPSCAAVYCCLKTTADLIRFIRLRDAGKLAECVPIIEDEIRNAQMMLKAVRMDSRIGFEAANHYYFQQTALLEKIVDCHRILKLIRNMEGHIQ